MITQKYAATIRQQQFNVSRFKSRPVALRFTNKTQQLLTATSVVIVNTFKKESICPLDDLIGYQVMLKYLVSDIEIDVVECVPKNFARVCKDFNTA
jgi:hypothetical protein